MSQGWRKETARDLIAFGSIPFLILTVIRVSFVGLYYPAQLVIGAALFLLFRAFLKAELRAGLGMVMFFFVSLYYKSLLFAVFALIIYAAIIVSLFYLKKDRDQIIKGIGFGALSTAGAYFIVLWAFF